MQSSLRIIVTGLITQHPRLGGMTWHYLQYILGLTRLGHDVYYLEDSGEFPYNLDGGASGTDWIARSCAYNVRYLARIMARFGLEERWGYHFPLKSEWYGLSDARRQALVDSADLLVNVSGSLECPQRYRRIPRLLYIDTDPVITQTKMALGNGGFAERIRLHDTHFSFGEALPESVTAHGVPATDYLWRPTRQPIVLSEWRPGTPRRDSFTTVMNWTSYEPLSYAGRTFGQKDIEFQRFLALPRQVAATAMEVALSRTQYMKRLAVRDGTPGPSGEPPTDKTDGTAFDMLTGAGWRVVDALEVCGDLDSYRDYIQASKAEWSVAKNAYVLGQPGWFSERSACYLAAGRPVVVQDTGFTQVLPTGEGILSFSTLPEAVAAIHDVQLNYGRHAQAARAIADAYFDADKVLSALIEEGMRDESKSPGAAPRELEADVPLAATVYRAAGVAPPDRGKPRRREQKPVVIIQRHLLEHPAVKAWAELCPGRAVPAQIEVLKQKTTGAVYRLAGAGPFHAGVIAKRCRHERAVIERPVYEQILPRLPVPTIAYFGCVQEQGGRFQWLFLEDVGNEPYSPFVAEHPALAARWLGRMHGAAESLKDEVPLPDRGPGHYRTYLQSARVEIPRIPVIDRLKPTDRTTLLNILSLCEFLDASWAQVEEFCDRMPRTLVHGDCLAKNVHVRTTPEGLTFAPFDWGGAGWGLPATDLGQLALPYRHLPPATPDCETYLSAVRDHWPDFDLGTIQQLANLGQMFWALKVISRSIPEFEHPGAHVESLMGKFGVYRSVLSTTVRAARWEN